MNAVQPSELIGLIPAAGRGVRFGLPFPKELLPILSEPGYVPVVQSVLSRITAAGVPHTVFVVNPAKHQLIEYFADGSRFACNLSYVVQQRGGDQGDSPSPGLAHALDSGYHLTRGKTVVCGMADTLLDPPDLFLPALGHFLAHPCDLLLLLFPAGSPKDSGMVDFDPDGTVRAVCDKPLETSLTKMWGAMIWGPVFTGFLHRCVQDLGIGDFARILNDAIAGGLVLRGFEVPGGAFADAGTPAGYARMAQTSRSHSAAFSAQAGGRTE